MYGKQVQELMDHEELIESCRRIHMIAIEQKLALKPEDYWWSSLGNTGNCRPSEDYLDGKYRRLKILKQYLDRNRNPGAGKIPEASFKF